MPTAVIAHLYHFLLVSHMSTIITTLCYARMNYNVGGLSPYGYHVVNVVLHSAVTVLFMVTCKQVAPRDYQMEPVLVAAIFAVHPVHVEAV